MTRTSPMRYTPPAPPEGPSKSADGCAEVADHTMLVWVPVGRPLLRRTADVALTALAIGGALCIVSITFGAILGVTPLVVRSGSMAPGIPVGSLVVVRPVDAAEVRPGDVVSVEREDGTRVTHRVVEVEPGPGLLTRLELQGDANSSPDAEPALASSVDRLVMAIPLGGSVLQRLVSPPAQFVGGVLTGAALLWSYGPPTVRRLGRWEPAPSTRTVDS
jgi:signal peptidase I